MSQINSNKYQIKGLSCISCTKLVTKRLEGIENVTAVEIKDLSGETKIESSSQVTTEQLQKALQGTDYLITEG